MNSTQASTRRNALVATGVAAVLTAGCLSWWVLSRRQPDTRADGADVSVSCVETAPHDSGYCERVAENVLRRRTPSPDQRAAAERAHQDVRRAISSGSSCSPSATAPCTRSTTKHPPTGAEAEATRQNLVREGFPNSAVRIARSDDPAPAGSLLYAVQVGTDTCIVGHIVELPGGGGGGFIGGVLPNGHCLDG